MNVLSPCQLFTFFSINFGLKKRKYNRQITKKINMARATDETLCLVIPYYPAAILFDRPIPSKQKRKQKLEKIGF